MLHALPDPLPNSDIQITDDLHLVALTVAEYEPGDVVPQPLV